jgi:cytochrome P450
MVKEVRSDQLIAAPPITSDPPDHKFDKQVLLPVFTQDQVEKLKPRTQAICN